MKFAVTPQLALVLKTARTQNNVSAKELAAAVGKSPSYISKLENGDTKTIQKDDLTAVLSEIYHQAPFYEVILPSLLRLLSTFQNPNEAFNQPWFLQYDTIDRPIVPTEALASHLKERLAAANLTIEGLANAINENADVDFASSYPPNQIIDLESGDLHRITYRVSTTVTELNSLFNTAGSTVPYSLIHIVFFMLIKQELYGKTNFKMPPDQSSVVLRETSLMLDQFDIHSLTGYSHVISSSDFIASRILSINAFGSIDSDIVCSLIDQFRMALDHDSLKTAQELEAFSHNLSWDWAFTLRLLGLPFYRLDDLSFRKKKALLEEIQSILERYDAIPEYEKRLEVY